MDGSLPVMRVRSWEDLVSTPVKEPLFWLDPYIAAGSVTFFWAKTSLGKSAISWEMARCISTGEAFFGLPTRQGRVLYVEVDMPEAMVQTRLKRHRGRPGMGNVFFAFAPPLHLPTPSPGMEEQLREAIKDINPDVIFLASLRKLHSLDDKDSAAPAIIYSWFQTRWPGKAFVFIHHARKSSRDFQEIGKESFSGSSQWMDIAQIGISLERHKDKRKGTNRRLLHHKTQGSAELRPMDLLFHLGRHDGTNWSCPDFDEMLKVYEIINVSEAKGGALDRELLLAVPSLGSESTARRRRLLIEEGLFPGTPYWLGTKGTDDEEEDGA
jgi:hypothetical protein